MSDQYDSGYAAGYRDAINAAERAELGKPPITLEDVKKMSQSEINARWDEVQQVLAANE